MIKITIKSTVLKILILLIFASCANNSSLKTETEKKAQLYYSYGTQNLIDKKYTSALTNLLQAAKLDPDNSKLHNNLGMAYYFKKDTSAAINHIKKAISLDEKNYDAYVNLASVYYNLKKYKLSKKYYLEVSKSLTYKNQFRVQYNLALIAFNSGDSISALTHLKSAIEENLDYCPAHYLRGRVLETSGKFKDALIAYKKSYHGPCFNNPAPHFKVGLMMMKNGNILEARMKFHEVVERFPTSNYSALSRNKINELKNTKGNQEPLQYSTNKKMKKIEQEILKYEGSDF